MMNSLTSRAGLVLCAMLLAACAATPVKQTPVLVQTPPRVILVPDPSVAELLAYHASVRLMTPSELAKAQQDMAAQDASAKNNLRRAMLAATVHGTGDLARAQALLEPIAQSTDQPALAPLAQLLSAHYAETRRQDEAIEKLNGQVRDAQRRNDQLNEKLEGLKNIERSLSVRPAAGAPK
jgi:hypothetical protein